ncbi:MAG: hypothetical protein KGL39_01520 [Patescibacteria group bacterium]|nr:hypothetical protein [Patescibacteria group bacterium]
MSPGQKLLLAIGIVLIAVAVHIAVKYAPKPELSFCDANNVSRLWQREETNPLQFELLTTPPTAPDRQCDVSFKWLPSGNYTLGYIPKNDPKTLYMAYGRKNPPEYTKHLILSNSRINELNPDGTQSPTGFKSRVV